MFVRASKYGEAMDKVKELTHEVAIMRSQLRVALQRLREAKPAPTFTPDEIAMLVRLCHPDKHNNSKAATYITSKLLKLKN